MNRIYGIYNKKFLKHHESIKNYDVKIGSYWLQLQNNNILCNLYIIIDGEEENIYDNVLYITSLNINYALTLNCKELKNIISNNPLYKASIKK